MRTIDGFTGPRAVAAAPDGSLLVADTDGDSIFRVRRGQEVLQDGSAHLAHGLQGACGIAVAPDGLVVVAEADANRILILDPRRETLTEVGTLGSMLGEFNSPGDVATDGVVIAVADTGNHRIQLLDMMGRPVAEFGQWGREQGQFRRPEGVAIDGERILVADTGNHRIQALNRDGSVVWSSGGWGSFPGLFSEPSGIDLFESRIIVADRLNHRIQVLDRQGKFLAYWGMHAVKPRQGEGRIHYPDDVAFILGGSEVAVAEGFEDRVQIFGHRGDDEHDPVDTSRKPGAQSHFGNLIALDGRALFLWEPAARSILVFDISHDTPIHVSTFGRPGTAPDALDDVVSLSYDADTSLLEVLDAGTRERKMFHVEMPPASAPRFDPTAVRLANTEPLQGDLDVRTIREACRTAHASDGSRFVARPETDRIEHLRGEAVMGLIGRRGTGHGELWEPGAVAIDESGRLFVVDHGNHRMQVFSQDGAWLMTFGTGRAFTPESLPKRLAP